MGEVTAPTVDELLAHAAWLTQLARALVGDAAAGDVVQETYAVALARPPQQAGPLRPWLGGVARNLAKMARRGNARRAAREDAVARVPAADVPSPEAVVARVQMQQRVARVVLDLGEPLRSTLLLRFYEGLTAAEIARAQGIPAGTVRSRLKDALDRVRATLDVEHGGDRAQWAALLVPLAVPDVAGAVAGGLLVKTSLNVLVGIVIAVLVVVGGTRWLGWWGGGDAAPAPVAVAAPGSAAQPAGPAPAPAPAGTARALPIVYDDDPAGTLRLEGQVIDADDQPIAGARVALDANPPRVVETEGDGSFVFERLIARDYRLEATAGEGYAGPARLRLTAAAEPVTLRMRRGGTLEVVVTRKPGGAPIAGADVELRSTLTWRATTNADGVARLRGLGPAWAPLAVRATGFAPAAMIVSTSGDPDVPARVAIALGTGAPVAGRVVDEAGKPVGGARVVATSASEPLPVVDPRRDGVLAGADGAFTLPALAAGTWRLTAAHGEHAPTTSAPITVDGVHPRTGVTLALAAGAIVHGTVRDRAGAPVAAADVSIVAQGHTPWRPRRQAFTDADGRFAITGLPRRPVDFVAWHERGASAIATADLAARRTHDLALVLDIGGAIAGTVVDSRGAPLGDAQVIAEPEWSGGVADRAAWSVRGVQQAVTDQAGAFRFAGLPAGTYRLRAARPGATEAQLDLAAGTLAEPGGAPVKLVVAADGRLVGKLALPDGTAPAAFSLALGWTHPTPFAAPDGAFALPAAAGTHRLAIRGLGFVEKHQEVTVAEGQDTDLGTITVTPGRSLSGRVLGETGTPVAGATVAAGSLLTGGGAALYLPDESPGAKDTQTDVDGRFVLAGFPPTTLTVIAGKDGVGRSASIRVPPSPDSATLDLVLAATSGLDGTVTRDGAPLADTVVIANPVGATASNFFVVTGPDGTFTLDALAPGPYIVYPMIGGGGGRPKDMYTRRVDVTLGARAKVAIDATPGPVTLTVALKTADGTPPPMAQVITFAAAIAPKSVTELRDGDMLTYAEGQTIPIYLRGARAGTIELAGLRPGPHTICVLLGNPMAGTDLTYACTPHTVTAATQQRATARVPAAAD